VGEPVRVLALDYGSARCGCAVSDPTGTIVTPLEHVLRPGTRKGFNRVLGLARERGVGRIVVGLPVTLRGTDSAQTEEVRAFAAKLTDAVRIPVELYDERFTTTIAAQRGGEGSEDSRAAAVLLEDWLAHSGIGGPANVEGARA
jgi:putative Holliday junction resolvase